PFTTAGGLSLTLGDVATVSDSRGPAVIRSEDARLAGWIYVDLHDRDVRAFVTAAQSRIDSEKIVPSGYHLLWSGHYQYLERAFARLQWVVPLTLAIIVVLLLMLSPAREDLLLALGPLPVAIIGAVWLMWALGMRLSVATVVGLIALAGLAVE